MKHFKPIYLQNLDLTVSGTQILRLQLNRHLRELDAIAPHTHDFDQVLVYLAGRGLQLLSGQQIPARTGSVFFVKAGVPHAFRETRGRRPLCLTLDLRLEDSRVPGAYHEDQLTQNQLQTLKQHLSSLMLCSRHGLVNGRFRVAGLVLAILDTTLPGAASLLYGKEPGMESPLARRVRRVLMDPVNRSGTLRQCAATLGHHPDHLNRLLKQQTGFTLGQIRSQELVLRAGRLLKQNLAVGEVAGQLGFSDQNYFARWFRQQTGSTPTAWRYANA